MFKLNSKNNFLNFAFLLLILFSIVSFSCKSSKSLVKLPYESVPIPPEVTELPVIEYTGVGIRYEVEYMLLDRFVVMYDEEASGNYCARLLDDGSTAKLKVKFPAGTYECLVSEKAFKAENSAFYVYIDDVPYRVYPSTPPLGIWELTTRVPVYFTLDEPRTVLITIQANSPKKNGDTMMNLDYIQFVKR